MRFFWRRDTQKKSKILRRVAFPFQYDATELCSDELKDQIVPVRDKFRELEKEKEELERSAKRARFSDSGDKDKANGVSEDKQKEFEDKYNELMKTEDLGSNPLGVYELTAIVTHQGASADSGHYQCFARNDKEDGKWWRFNDDKVSIVDEARIEMLAGGGESDSALILLYRTARL
jgi:ubiquitin carboxyl-terminal hydrolase 14